MPSPRCHGPLWDLSYIHERRAPTRMEHPDLSQAHARVKTLKASQHIAASCQRHGPRGPATWSFAMLHYAVVFFIIALIAALFGFGGIAASAVGIAKILFFVFAILAVASFLFGLIKKG